MRLDDLDDGNLDDDVNANYQRGGGGFRFPMGGGGGLPVGGRMGCGTLVIVLIAALVFGVNPGSILGDGSSAPTQQVQAPAHDGLLHMQAVFSLVPHGGLWGHL